MISSLTRSRNRGSMRTGLAASVQSFQLSRQFCSKTMDGAILTMEMVDSNSGRQFQCVYNEEGRLGHTCLLRWECYNIIRSVRVNKNGVDGKAISTGPGVREGKSM